MENLKSKMQSLKDEVDGLHCELEAKTDEVKQMVVDREHSETELASIRRQLKLSESTLERSENAFSSVQKRLQETQQSAEDCEKLNSSLNDKTDSSNEKLELLQVELKEAKECEVQSEMKCHEVSKKLANIEAEYEKIDKKATDYEKKIVDLEKEMSTVNNTLHSLESNSGKDLSDVKTGDMLSAREEECEITIKNLLKTLEEVEEKRSTFERSSQKLKRDIEIAKENLNSWQTKSGQIKREMGSMLADVNNI